jgi:WD40 repeat protein
MIRQAADGGGMRDSERGWPQGYPSMASLRSTLRRHRGKVLIEMVFLASVAFFWWRLPPSPRLMIPSDSSTRVLAVSPDGTLLALTRERQLKVLSLSTGKTVAAWPVTPLSVQHAVFTPNGRRLIANDNTAAGSHFARIYRVGSAEIEAELPLGVDVDFAHYLREPRSFLLSPDGSCLVYLAPKEGPSTARSERLVKVWDVSNAREKAVLSDRGVFGAFPPLAFSPDGRYLAVGSSSESPKDAQPVVKIWDVATGRLAHTLTLPWTIRDVAQFRSGCVALTFTRDGHGLIGFVSSSMANDQPALLRWDLDTGTLQESLDWEREWHSPGASVALDLAGGDKHVVIQGLEGLQTAYLCDLAGLRICMQKVFLMSPPLLDHRGTHVATPTRSYGSGPFGIKMPGDVIEPPRVLLLDVSNVTDEREVCRSSSFENGFLVPLAFSPDDRTLATNVHYWLFGDRWYTPIVKWLLDPDHPVRFFDVASGRCLARLPGMLGTDVLFTPDGKTVVTGVWAFRSVAVGQDGKPVLPSGEFPIRVYDYPLRAPVGAIMAWSLLPTAAAVILLGGLRYLLRTRKRGRTMPGQPPPSVDAGGGSIADATAVGGGGSEG